MHVVSGSQTVVVQGGFGVHEVAVQRESGFAAHVDWGMSQSGAVRLPATTEQSVELIGGTLIVPARAVSTVR